ncbi:bifunctional DNA primase/polymerase [Nocardiopsis sp. CNR-923]|uniref:bifunctional DNA primase/polymerase n=1 Tax=Nocardiopsis sp. CNR-923 TaxID=1904965 RepID=UPI0009F9B703|nr:bifunctional DNA primase/polymerase [Nocardiopsis sp. CNR-923]
MCERDGCDELVADARGGRIPKYCSGRCRVAAHRARHAIPAELRERRRWVRRDEDKVPLMVKSGRRASSTAPGTWGTYADAVASRHGVGLGYVLRQGDGVVCIDLDHCLWGDRVSDWAQRILDRCPSTFVERSASGSGLHIWGRGEMPRGRRIRRDDGSAVEVYGTGRYIALGERWRSAPLQLADLTEVIDSLT